MPRRISSEAIRRYKKFHGKKPDRVSTIDFTPPKALIRLGEGVAVEYRSTKKLYGTHKSRHYRHKFSRGVCLYAHPKGNWLLIHGGRFRVSDWLRG